MQRQVFSGLRVTTLGTLASRILGMVRDIATASLFGLASGGVMDAFVVAFRIPNLFRRLFGEGALTASYLPVLTEQLESDRRGAWQLASVMLVWLTVLLIGLLLAAEAVCAATAYFWGDAPGMSLLVGLTATLLPYMVWICLVAQLAATLHALNHFTAPALAPVLLNVSWLIGVWLVAPRLAPDKHAQAYALAICILVAGVLQFAVLWPPLLRLGFRFDYNGPASRDALRAIARAMLPTAFGLAVTQLNTLGDVLLAWGLAAAPESPATIGWLPGEIDYPMEQGAAAAIYYGERLYQFPLGILGIAVATVIFPRLSRHAARGEHDRIGGDLTLGLRLVLVLALPASAGLVLLAEPIAVLLFQRGEFTAGDAGRTAAMIACYASGVWAYCALPVLIRGFYAHGDRVSPVRIGVLIVAANLGLNLALVWPLGERGLAISTALCAAGQVLLLAFVFSRHAGPLDWPALRRSVLVASAATLVMAGCCEAAARWTPGVEGFWGRVLSVAVPLTVGLFAYLAALKLLDAREFDLLLGRVNRSPEDA